MENQVPKVDFTVDTSNLYREESITDFKIASIRKMTPINLDGSDDDSRTPMFMGHTQLMSPDGPVPLQTQLEAENLEEAIAVFPEAMKKALEEMFERVKQMQQDQQQKDDSRIIVPGR